MAVKLTKETSVGLVDEDADLDAINKQLEINEKNAATILNSFMASRTAQAVKETK